MVWYENKMKGDGVMKSYKKSIAAALALLVAVTASGTPAAAAPKKDMAQVKSVKIQKPGTAILVLKKDASYQVKTKVKGTGSISKKVVYKSSDPKVVKVSSGGKITAKKEGTAKIIAASEAEPSKNAVLTVKVGTPVEEVKLDSTLLDGEKGTSVKLKASVLPKNATEPKVAFTSSDASVAKV